MSAPLFFFLWATPLVVAGAVGLFLVLRTAIREAKAGDWAYLQIIGLFVLALWLIVGGAFIDFGWVKL